MKYIKKFESHDYFYSQSERNNPKIYKSTNPIHYIDKEDIIDIMLEITDNFVYKHDESDIYNSHNKIGIMVKRVVKAKYILEIPIGTPTYLLFFTFDDCQIDSDPIRTLSPLVESLRLPKLCTKERLSKKHSIYNFSKLTRIEIDILLDWIGLQEHSSYDFLYNKEENTIGIRMEYIIYHDASKKFGGKSFSQRQIVINKLEDSWFTIYELDSYHSIENYFIADEFEEIKNYLKIG